MPRSQKQSQPPSMRAILGGGAMVLGIIVGLFALIMVLAGEPVGGLVLGLPAALLIFGGKRLSSAVPGGTEHLAVRPQIAVTVETRAARHKLAGARARGEHRPAEPTGEPLQPWLRRTTSIEVVGEFYRQESLRRLFAGIELRSESGGEIRHITLLADDSKNPHDSNAVAVWLKGEHVGYLERTDAREYSSMVRQLAVSGYSLEVPARAWARQLPDGSVAARVTLWMPDPSGIFPINALPAGPHVVLPAGGRVQVTKEDQHMDVLGAIVSSGVEVPIVTTLHAILEARTRSSTEAVEVRYDGKRIGILSPTMSTQLLPLVKYVEERGRVAVARAAVSGSSLKAEANLSVVRASEVDDAWLASLGGPVPQ